MAGITFSESSGVADSIFGKSQAPIQRFIEKRAENHEQNSVIRAVFDMNTSKNYAEKIVGLTGMDSFGAVGENGAYPVAGMSEGYSKVFEHMTWKNSFALSREIVEDSKTIDLRRRPEAFIASYHRTRERFGAALFGAAINNSKTITFGGNTFETTCYDGSALFSKAHYSLDTLSTQCNIFSNDFSADALGMLESRMQNFTGENGETLDIAPDTIIIPNIHSLKKIVFSEIGCGGDIISAGNGFNYQYGRWNVIVWPELNKYIGTNKPWILFDSRYNKSCGCAVWFDRTPLEVSSRIDDNTDANVWRGYARFSAGFNDWHGFALAGVTSGNALS